MMPALGLDTQPGLPVSDKEIPASIFNLTGRVALVTGASAGLGFAIAQGFSAAGAVVALHGRDAKRTIASAARVDRALPIIFDITDTIRAGERVEALIEQQGRLDILVCNAGIRDRRTFLDISTEQLREVLDTNLTANIELVRLVVPQMIKQGGGRLIFITSTAAARGTRRGSTYAASKGGMDALTRALAVELGPRNILVNAISPGYIATEYNEMLTQDTAVAKKIGQTMPLRRWGLSREVIGPALLLASDAGSFINGQTITVDGGMSISG